MTPRLNRIPLSPVEAWEKEAACRGLDTDSFYPEKDDSIGIPKRVCRACPVRLDCLEHALRLDDQFGIRGGLTPEERRRIRRGTAAQVVGEAA